MSDLNLIPSLKEKLSKDFSFDIQPVNNSIEGTDQLDAIRKMLTKRILELMEKDFEKFVNILYRLDIHEEKVREVFNIKQNDKLPHHLADLIIERQLKKIETRLKYKAGRM